MDLIQQLEQEEIARLGKNIPDFAPGDTVVVNVNVVEGTRKRAQAYEGVAVPPVLMGGNHAEVNKWRRERMLEATAHKRPDLLEKARAAGLLGKQDEKFLAGLAKPVQ